MDYSLGDWFPVPDIPAGTNLLVTGPPMTGKYDLLLRLLVDHTEATVVISTSDSADRVRRDFRSVPDRTVPEALGIVDCVSVQRGVETVADDATTRYVNSPENLTQVGVKFTEFFDEYRANYERVSVGLHSLSQLLMYSELRSVYQFLQVLTGKIQSADWLGVAVLDASMHDEQTRNTLKTSFDGVVETRENEQGGREFRVKGLRPTASEWTAF